MTISTKRSLAAIAVAGMLTASTAFAQANLTAETSSAGNSPHLSVIHLADVAARDGVADIQVQEGQTATNAVVNLAEGKTDIASVPLVLHFLLEHGRGPFSSIGDDGAELASNLRALFPYNAGAYGLLAHVSTGIEKWTDLEGRTVWNGPPRGAALVNARQAITLGSGGFEDGKQYKGYQTNWGQLPTALVDGSADAFVLPLTFPSERAIIALSAGEVNIVSTPKDIFESEAFGRLLNAPGNIPVVIAEVDMGYGTSKGVHLISEDGMFRGLGTAFATMARADLPEDVVKALVASYIATLPELKARTPYAANVNFDVLDADTSGFCGPLSLKYHPGAIAAWEEAGYTVPDCAK